MAKPIFCMHSFNSSMSPRFSGAAEMQLGKAEPRQIWNYALFITCLFCISFLCLWQLLWDYSGHYFLFIWRLLSDSRSSIVSVAVLVSSICDNWEEGSEFSETHHSSDPHVTLRFGYHSRNLCWILVWVWANASVSDWVCVSNAV